MDWITKFEIVSKCVEINEDIEQDFYIKEAGISKECAELMRDDHPLITQDYFDFLTYTDGADIAQCRIYSFSEYKAGMELYSDVYDEKHWFVFGADAGGDPLLLHETGKIAIGVGKSIFGEFTFIADTFSDFLNSVLMGPNYPSLFGLSSPEYNEFYREEAEEDPWLNFLIEKGWIDRVQNQA